MGNKLPCRSLFSKNKLLYRSLFCFFGRFCWFAFFQIFGFHHIFRSRIFFFFSKCFRFQLACSIFSYVFQELMPWVADIFIKCNMVCKVCLQPYLYKVGEVADQNTRVNGSANQVHGTISLNKRANGSAITTSHTSTAHLHLQWVVCAKVFLAGAHLHRHNPQSRCLLGPI